MAYDLSRLGNRQFELLARALAAHYIGPQVGVFDAYKYGGRRATWERPANDRANTEVPWDGYGVLQTKYKSHFTTRSENSQWLISAINSELDEWVKEDVSARRIPDSYLIVTNVKLLQAAEAANATNIVASIRKHAHKLGLAIRTFAIWDYDQIKVLLDEAEEIHAAYAAWITPGDVLAQLVEARVERIADLEGIIYTHTAKTLIDDVTLNLTQAGTVADKPVGVADVFVDLPAIFSSAADSEIVHIRKRSNNAAGSRVEGIAEEVFAAGDRKFDPMSVKQDTSEMRANRLVLVGGPGQGKSTIGQFVCQIYRARFLTGTRIANNADVDDAIKKLDSHSAQIQIAGPCARRWPYAIKLTALADALAANRQNNLLGYIAAEISERVGSAIGVSDLKHWLAKYPWFLVLDGLDEVPASSNREQMLRVIRDFLLDASSVSADVLVLATTRPQGYNEDFDPRLYRHFLLSELPTDIALSYAKRLLEVRLGSNSPRVRTVYDRVCKAAAEEATARLLVTPLQVTILALLVERLGQAPKDRWRLFSQYYRVIYQREQEKGGPLAEILHDFETHIHAIHREAGFSLQARGEQAGEAVSSFTSEQLTQLISDRLASSGYTTVKAHELALEFRSVFTDRLVFLTEVSDNIFGFEIRSLQEFMAGEAVVQQLESRTSTAFRDIATSSYWRNTFLFAVGKIFAERDHLCGEVVTLCVDLNVSSKANRLAAPGSELALAILSEGVARTQPGYSRPLASCACAALSTGSPVVGNLPELDMAGLHEELDSAIADALRGSDVSRMSAAMVLALRSNTGNQEGHESLRSLISEEDPRFLRSLVRLAWINLDIVLLSIAAERILDEGPAVLTYTGFNDPPDDLELDSFYESVERSPGLVLPDWLLSYIGFVSRGFRSDGRIGISIFRRNDLEIHFNSLNPERSYHDRDPRWEDIANIPRAVGAWGAVRAIAIFAAEPSAKTLADALEQSSEYYRETQDILIAAPWPLEICYTDACWPDDFSPGDEEKTGRRLKELAQAARAGELGDVTHWSRAEERWKKNVNLEEILLPQSHSACTAYGPLPFSPEIAERGLILPNTGLSAEVQPYRQEGLEKLASIYNALPVGRARTNWVGLALFSIQSARDEADKEEPLKRNNLFCPPFDSIDADTARGMVRDAPGPWWNLNMLTHLDPEVIESPEVVSFAKEIGKRSQLRHFFGSSLSSYFSNYHWDNAENWPLARLTLHLSQSVNEQVLEFDFNQMPSSRFAHRTLTFMKVLCAIENGSLSAEFARSSVRELHEPMMGKRGEYVCRPYDSVNLDLLMTHMSDITVSDVWKWLTVVQATLEEFPPIGVLMVREVARSISEAKAFSDS